MYIKLKVISVSCLILFGLSACETKSEEKSGEEKSPLDYVDMKIGTAEQGNTIVGPGRPFAMVKPGPDTEMRRNYLHAEYITGFSQLHISGTGGNAQSATLGIMPTVGDVNVDPRAYRSRFDPRQATTEPGYCSFLLDDYNITTEITSTDRVALYRFTFPESVQSNILIDLSHAFNVYRGGSIEIVNDSTIVGTGKYNGYHGSNFDIAFNIEFSRPFLSSGIWKQDQIFHGQKSNSIEGSGSLGAFLGFNTEEDETILVKIGISYVDIEGAKRNTREELNHWDFEAIVAESKNIWEELLSKVQVKTQVEEQKTTFYTALYHAMLSPSVLSDVDNRYEGFDGLIHEAEGFNYYGEFSLWDTYRTVHPLYVLLEPKRQRDMVVSLLKIAEQGGWLPTWAWSEGYTGGMFGDHSVSVILDSYAKGIRDFDVNKAYEAMYKNATEQKVGVPWSRRGLYKYMELGFAPEDAGITKSLVAESHAYGPGGAQNTGYYPEVSGSASTTLEYAYNDWCVAEMANFLGREEDAEYFRERALYYKNVYDPNVGFMRPRNSDGSWAMDPFGPTISGQHSQFYCEGNAWTYTWYVPHDIEGLINLMEGRDNFISKLDTAFLGLETGQSYYDPENEPDLHYPYLFNYAGAPWKSQQFVRHITENIFTADHETGLPGDDDVGTMSAWYIFSSMGFYPVLPGSDQYVIGSPLFDEVKIFLDEEYYGGRVLLIESVNNSSENKYIQSMKVNGAYYNKTWITHDDLVNNGHLVFNMGDSPNKNWGIGNNAEPMSMTTQSPDFVYSDLIAPENCLAGEFVNVQVTVTNKGSLGTAHVRLYQSDRNIHFRMQHPMGEKRLVLDANESRIVEFNVPIYYHGVNTLSVDTLSTHITVPRPDFRKRYYADEKNQYEKKVVNIREVRGQRKN